MQLSVSTSPADPSLATLPPAGDLSCPANSGGNATSFGAQFPLLAPTPPASPTDVTVAPTTAAVVPTWIGSTIPQIAAQPRLPSLSGKPAAPVAKGISGTSGDVLPASVPNTVTAATPMLVPASAAEPASARPTSRGARHDETTLPLGVNPLSAEMAQALAVAPVPVNSAPVVLTLTETAPTEDAVSADAATNRLIAPSSLRGTTVPTSPLAPTAVATSTTPAVATSDPIGGELSPRSAVIRSAPDSGRFAADVPPREVGEMSPAVSRPAVDSVEVAAPQSELGARAIPTFGSTVFAEKAPVSVTTASAAAAEKLPANAREAFAAAPDETPAAVRSFAPAEIHSRQFAFTSISAPSADFTSSYGSSRAGAFVPAPVTSAPAPLSLPVDAAEITPPTFPLPFAATASLAQSAPPAPASVADAAMEISSAIASGAVESTATAPREFTPGSRAEKNQPARGAKIAATGEFVSFEKNREENVVAKTFVNVSSERVARSGAAVGTDVAKSEVTMSSPFTNHLSSAAVLEHAPVAPVAMEAADRSADFSATSVLAPETTEAAHRAVEAVLTAVERFTSGERHSVNLNFSVGGNDLNVRVELRADEVHATFLTDSPELRTALAREWQAAHSTTDSADRPLRLVTPVFASQASSTSTNLSSFSGGDSSSRQRESGARRSAADFAAVSGVRSSGARSSTLGAAADSTSASPVARSAPPTSHRLHTHA